MHCPAICLLLLLAGCAVDAPKDSSSAGALATGTWKGELRWSSTIAVGDATDGRTAVVFANCDGEPRFYWRDTASDAWSGSASKWKTVRLESSYLLYFAAKSEGVGWVETQSLALVEGPNRSLAASWSRSVDNRGVPERDMDRRFVQSAIGHLSYDSAKCSGF